MSQAFLEQARLIPLDWANALGRELNTKANQYFFTLLLQQCKQVLDADENQKIESHLNSGKSFNARMMIEPLAAKQNTSVDSVKDSLYMVAVLASLLSYFEQQFPLAYQAIEKDKRGFVILSADVAAIIFAQGPAPEALLEQLPFITEMLKEAPSVI